MVSLNPNPMLSRPPLRNTQHTTKTTVSFAEIPPRHSKNVNVSCRVTPTPKQAKNRYTGVMGGARFNEYHFRIGSFKFIYIIYRRIELDSIWWKQCVLDPYRDLHHVLYKAKNTKRQLTQMGQRTPAGNQRGERRHAPSPECRRCRLLFTVGAGEKPIALGICWVG